MSLSPTPEQATVNLRRTESPIIEKVGEIYSCTARRISHAVVVSNQPTYVSQKFAQQYPELSSQGYNNLYLSDGLGLFSLLMTW